jgi:hypothetical protein
MSIQISPEIEVRLTNEAQKQGVSVDTLLARLMSECQVTTNPVPSKPELPVWHLGSAGALHRRDIYDDAV